MRALILGLALLPGVAYAQWGGGFVPKSVSGAPPPPPLTCTQGAAFVDGCPAAPAGTAQLPTLLNSYAVRPPWNVAGVDYRTGPPTGTALADPATISVSGVTVNAGSHTVTVNGSNITLSGYNFGLANGWTVTVNGANDTIQNSLFKVGSNNGALGTVLDVTSAASNFSFLANEVDGSSIGVTVQAGYTIGFVNSGTLKIQYNYLHDSGGDMVEIQEGNWTNQQIRYNLFQNIGLETDHSDTIQWCRSVIAAGNMDFNTMYQPNSGLSGEGLLTLNSECTGSNIRNVTVRNNVGLSISATPQPGTGNQDNFGFGQTITQDAGAAAGDHNATYNNYINPTGIDAFTGSPWFPMTGFNTGPAAALGTPAALHTLINMVNNTQIPVPSSSAPQGGYYVYPDLNGYSPCLCDIFSITPSPASGNRTTGQTVTFTVLMDAATTVTGTPMIALNSGGSATYTSGSGTKTLTFTYTVGSGDGATTLAVTSVSGTMKDDVGNTTLLSPLTNLSLSYAGLSVNSGGSGLAFTALTGAAINTTTPGSGTYTGSAPSGLTNAVYGAACTGSSTVSGFSASAGTWHATFTTPIAGCTGTMTVTGTGANTATATSPSTTFTGASSCPDNDGATGASAGTPQYPGMLSGYTATINGANGLGCQVAGVDYHVGLPAGQALVVPTSGNLPAGASISGNQVDINSNNVTFQGFDMTGKRLGIGGGVSGTIVQKNKFQTTATCLEPILFQNAGNTTIQYNDIDGGGNICTNGYFNGFTGDINVAPINSGATLTIQYNYNFNTFSDNIALTGGSGAAAVVNINFNLFDSMGTGGVGAGTAHPDGIQYSGGNFNNTSVKHNTLYQPLAKVNQVWTQPLHIEAQNTSTITNTTVAYNTLALPGTVDCVGGNYPTNCTANSVIHCKGAGGSNSNDVFAGYGNYIDWRAALSNIESDGCTNVTWNSPQVNKDMRTGGTLTPGMSH